MNSHRTEYPQRIQTDAPNSMARTPLRCASPSLPNFNKATKAIGVIREEEQKGGTPNFSKI
jgi:hypothetical protein